MIDNQRTNAVENLSVLGGLTIGLLLAIILSIIATNSGGLIGVCGFGCAIVLAAFVIGSFLGFLFSVPRVLTQSASNNAEAEQIADKPNSEKRRFLQTNTNLERISDWLTTMLVGVGLSQIGNINAALVGFRQYVGQYRFASPAQTNALATVSPLCLILGLIAGFLAMYIYTRIVLAGIFNDVEGGLYAPLPDDAQQAVTIAAQQAQADGASSAAIVEAANPAATVTVQASVSVMFDLLYEPEGYKRVIEIGEQLADTAASSMATYWFYLAAAYGQLMATAQAEDAPDKVADARRRALTAATRAVQISPAYKSRLWQISNPDGIDNDLALLRDDPAFRKLVGR